jgi:hypothetical protein
METTEILHEARQVKDAYYLISTHPDDFDRNTMVSGKLIKTFSESSQGEANKQTDCFSVAVKIIDYPIWYRNGIDAASKKTDVIKKQQDYSFENQTSIQ